MSKELSRVVHAKRYSAKVRSKRRPVTNPLNLLLALAIPAHMNGYIHTDIAIRIRYIIKPIIIYKVMMILKNAPRIFIMIY